MRITKALLGSAIFFYLTMAAMAVASLPADSAVASNNSDASHTVQHPASQAVIDIARNDTAVDKALAPVPDWLQLAGLIISGFAIIAAATPTPKDDGVLKKVRLVIDLLGLNIGNAKNAVPRDKNILR